MLEARDNTGGDAIGPKNALVFGWVCLLITILVLGWWTVPSRSHFPPRVERIPENAGIYRGWVPTAHPLGTAAAQGLDEDRLDLLLMGLARTMTGPLLACLVAVLLGGIWGAWAAYAEGPWDRVLRFSAVVMEAIPRIVLFVMITRLIRGHRVHLNLLQITVGFAFFQIPAVAMSLRNHIRSVAREGFLEGLVSLGFSRRTIVFRDLLQRECASLLQFQYMARVTELVALETAFSYALGGSDERTVGWVLRQINSGGDAPQAYQLLVISCLALYLITLTLLARPSEAKEQLRFRAHETERVRV